MKVTVKNGNIEGGLRTLKRKVMADGLLIEARAREFYEKPCDKRNRKRQSAIVRERKRNEENTNKSERLY